MGSDGNTVMQITVRLPTDDYFALEAEAKEKQTPLAAYVRDLLQLHLSKRDFSEQFEHEFERILTSGKYDDKIVETFLRAYKYKNGK